MTGLGIPALALTALAGFALLRRSGLLPAAHPTLQLSVGAALSWAVLTLVIPLGGGALQPTAVIFLAIWLGLGVWAAISLRESLWPTGQLQWRHPNDDASEHATRATKSISLSYWLILGLLGCHLLLVVTENWLRPTLPWDAWTTWIYRGKAWFFDQALTPALPALEWSQQPDTTIAVEAHHYPRMVSVLTAVVATLDGGWYESSISLQGGLLALALAFGMYGGARTLGLTRHMAALVTTATVSLPLVMSHLSLAGYADLWQALYSSTALVLLLVYRQPQLKPGHTRWLVAALVLAAAGMLVKSEGVLWFMLVVAIALLISQRTRRAALLAAAMGVISLGCVVWLAPITIVLPGLGTWGISDDALQLGIFGSEQLVVTPVIGVYLSQLVVQQNFSILAPLLVVGLAALWLKKHPLAEIASWILVAPLAVQVAIFGLTDYGLFALTGTASARLLLHFIPVVVLITALGWQAMLSKPAATTLRAPVLGAATSISLCVLIATSWLASQSPQQLRFNADELQVLGGNQTNTEAGSIRFTDIQGPVGVMGKPLPPTEGKRFPLVLAGIDSDEPEGLAFFWRDANGGLNSYPLTATELPVLNLTKVTAWYEQQAIEIGLLQRPIERSEINPYPTVRSLVLADRLALRDWQAVLVHWATPIPVSLRSVNALAAPDLPGVPTINTLLCIAALVLAVLQLVLGQRLSSQFVGAAIVTLGLVAISQNVARQVSGLEALDTPAARLLAGETLSPLVSQLQASTDEPVLITYFDEGSEFIARRLSYELLPQRAGVVPPTAIPADWQGAIAIMAVADDRRAALVAQLASHFTLLASDEQHLLLVPKE